MLTTITNMEIGAVTAKPTTQLTHHDFNSYCKVGDKYLACGADGLYEIGGDTYDGVEISSEIEFPATDLGISDEKRMSYLYFSGELEGDMTVAIAFDKNMPLPAVTIAKHPGKNIQTLPVKLAEGAKGVHITANLKNVDGGDFTINRLELLPTIIKRIAKRF